MDESALVLFSGGQDSTTCLAWALERFPHVETIGFSYGQRHAIELACRPRILAGLRQLSSNWSARLGVDHLIDASTLTALGSTALTAKAAIKLDTDGLPTTFVPGRNLVFFTFAAALAYRRGAKHLVGGMCETDYSGYPDCRDDTLKALQVTLNLGMASRFVLHTPLMWIDKAETWRMAAALGGATLVDLILEETHSCYLGDRETRHPWGYGCNTCPACDLRMRGWTRFSSDNCE
ncbi:MAG: 7-cyano-7-deazaguanine synthase QueC [Alphaproteobacteria bacterium]